MTMSRFRSYLGIAGLLFVAGCGSGTPATTRVDGVLLFEDGKPVSGASIRFVPAADAGREASGFTGKDGEFTLTSFSQSDGALPGDYSVVVTKSTAAASPATPVDTDDPEVRMKAMKEAMAKSKAPAPKVVDPVPAVYADAKTTPLKQKIDSSTKKIELKLKRK
jgi:hypothetical protein